jgi:FkbM family methyltransferase
MKERKMNKLPRIFNVLSQLSLRQNIVLCFGLFLQTILRKLKSFADYKIIITNFNRFISEGNAIKKERGNKNTLFVQTDDEIGAYSLLIRRLGSDFDVYDEVLKRKEYKSLIDLITRHVPANSITTIVDAGGNIGCTALYLKKKYPNAHIVVIEPNRSTFDILEQNVKRNALENITLLQMGLWNEPAHLIEATTSFGDGREWAFALQAVAAGKSKENATSGIEGITLAHLIDTYFKTGIDILKIDIEGAEQAIFTDPVQVHFFLSKVKFIAIELHGTPDIREKIEQSLTDNGFEFHRNGAITFGRNVVLTRD